MINHLDLIKSKIYHINQELEWQLAVWRFHERKIVFTNGCFDLMHRGHIEYLAQAASEGNLLIIGLNTDESVRRIKGNSRPVLDEYSRAMNLAALGFVGAVVYFDDDTPQKLIELVQPDVLVKGKDYSKEEIIGADIVEAKGGSVVTVELVEGHSTSSLIEKIKNS